MTTPREQVRDVREWTAEDVEALAAFMGWERCGDWWSDTGCGGDRRYVALAEDWPAEECEARYAWNPFKDANADLQVLERAREVWAGREFGCLSGETYRLAKKRWVVDANGPPQLSSWECLLRYSAVGDYSRAVLAVLRSTEGE